MAAYKCEKDFIERTQEIVNGYPQGNKVTMLLNCMLGLLVFPKEKYSDKIESAPYTEWGIKDSISICKAKNGKDSKKVIDVIRHLRNAVCHGHFEMKDERGEEKITHVEFYDCQNKKKPKDRNFEAKISTEELKKFLLKFSDHLLKELK